MRNRTHSTIIPILAFMFISTAIHAQTFNNWITIQLDWDNFGHLSNSGPRCAPTATANSFQYLYNTYPDVYGNTTLIDGSLSTTRDELSTLMNADANGATDQDWWEGKLKWIDEHAPGTTTYAGMVNDDPTGWYKSQYLVGSLPTWDFLWNQMIDGEDVELGIYWSADGTEYGHALTLTSLEFNDLNQDGIWDDNEVRKLDYLDPNNPNTELYGDLSLDNDGALSFLWNNSRNPAAQVSIQLAYAESVPESSVFVQLGVFSCVGIVFVLRRRYRAKA